MYVRIYVWCTLHFAFSHFASRTSNFELRIVLYCTYILYDEG